MSEFTTFLVGCYTDSSEPSPNSDFALKAGILSLQLCDKTGQLTLCSADDRQVVDTAMLGSNPSYLTQSAQGLYCVNELSETEGAAIQFFPASLNAAQAKSHPIQGDYPCHLAKHKAYLAVANYGSGNVLVYGLNEKGQPDALLANLFQSGAGTNLERQSSPHAHQVTFLNRSDQLVVVDLGADRVHFYDYDADHRFTLSQSVIMPAGSGPRHLVFNRAETRAYVVCELSETLVSLTQRDHQWQIESEIALLPHSTSGEAAAAVRLSHDERHLYVSCRAQNKLVLFNLIGDSPVWQAAFDCGGDFPRDFILTSDNRWLLVANQHSGNVVSFHRDAQTGNLSASGFDCMVPQAVCLLEQGVLRETL